jgi:tryptophanyl-tRNA synthetase
MALGDLVADFVDAFGSRTRELLDDKAELDRILAGGAATARGVAAQTLATVYDRSGFVPGGDAGPRAARDDRAT